MNRMGPLRHRRFRLQFAAVSISSFGTTMSPVALAFAVLHAGYSAGDLGLILGIEALAIVCVVMIGGALADIWAPTTVMIGANALRGCAQVATGGILLFGDGNLAAIVLLQLALGVGTGLFEPADNALTPQTVDESEVQHANSLIHFVWNTFGIAGPLIAGVATVADLGPHVIVVDGMTFLVSAVLIVRIAAGRRYEVADDRNIWRATVVGLRTAVRLPWLRRTLAFFAAYGIVYSSIFVLGPTSLNSMDDGAIRWSLVTAGLASGNIVGSLIAMKYRPRQPIRQLYLASGIAIPLLLVLGIPGGKALCLATGIGAGLAFSLTNIIWLSTLQTRVPRDRLSRVNALDTFVSLALRPAGYALAPMVAALTSARAVLWSGAIAVAVIVASCTLLDRRTASQATAASVKAEPT